MKCNDKEGYFNKIFSNEWFIILFFWVIIVKGRGKYGLSIIGNKGCNYSNRFLYILEV